MQDIEREAMDIQLQDKLLEYKQQMGLLGAGSSSVESKQIGAAPEAAEAEPAEQVIETEAEEAQS
jgi:hypothetical protein